MAEYSYHDQVEMQSLTYVDQITSQMPRYVTTFFRGISQTHSPRTRLMYAREIQHFFDYIVESYTDAPVTGYMDISLDVLSSIDHEFIEDYLYHLQNYRDKSGVQRRNNDKTIKRKLCAISVLYKYLYKHEMVTGNPVSKVDMPKIHEKAIVRMDAAETANFLDTVEFGNNLSARQMKFHEKTKERDLAIMTLMLSTGIRISECVGLDLTDVDIENTSLRVIRKGGKEAVVYFSDEAADALRVYLAKRKKIDAEPGSEHALFLSEQRKRLGVRSIQNLVKKYARIAVPLKKITPHKLRSTFGTALYNETSDIYLVADVLGHNDVNTTRKHYADMDDYKKRQSRNVVKLREDSK